MGLFSQRADRAWPKRSFDLVVAALLLILLSPFLVLCGVAVLLGGGPPILFRQERVGQCGRSFKIVKFRTMRSAPGADVTAAGDARVTAVGSILRWFKLDELPQLWNVLVGDMSMVGPRPELPRYVRGQMHAYRAILLLRPGVSDFASLIFRDEEEVLRRQLTQPAFYERVLLPRKLALARLYKQRRSLCVDLQLVVATACAIFLGSRSTRLLLGVRLYNKARGGIVEPVVHESEGGRMTAQ